MSSRSLHPRRPIPRDACAVVAVCAVLLATGCGGARTGDEHDHDHDEAAETAAAPATLRTGAPAAGEHAHPGEAPDHAPAGEPGERPAEAHAAGEHADHGEGPGAAHRDHHDETHRDPPSDADGSGQSGDQDEGHREDHADDHADDHGGEVRVALAGLTGIAFTAVGPAVEEGAWTAAEAVADEAARHRLAAPVGGVVATIRVPPGREVPAGAPLVELRSTELAELRSRLLVARAERERAAAELAREERLATVGAGALRELEAARAALAIAEANAESARLALEARGIDPEQSGAVAVLRAPRAGRVAVWNVLAGEGVAAGAELGTFDAGRAALVRVELALPGAPGWVPGAEARVRRGDGATWRARVEGVPQSLETISRRLVYRLRITEDGTVAGELPVAGTPLEVRVPLPPGVVLPQTALQQIEGTWGVFVVEGAEARFRPVRRGPELGGDVLVLAGIEPGERLATTGAYLLKSLYLKRAGGGDAHAH
jgi:cobalt-zinc-cadmium efflux system membrane fusion protein